MNTTRINPRHLIGPALDYAVAAAKGFAAEMDDSGELIIRRQGVVDYFNPSTNWGWAGAIIEDEGIALRQHSHAKWYAMRSADLGDTRAASWSLDRPDESTRYGPFSYQILRRQVRFDGDTPLIAAMRCFVAHEFGSTVPIPQQFLRTVTPKEIVNA